MRARKWSKGARKGAKKYQRLMAGTLLVEFKFQLILTKWIGKEMKKRFPNSMALIKQSGHDRCT